MMNVSVGVCMFVCTQSYLRNYSPIFTTFLCLLPMAVARSSSGGPMIRYVFPVLRVTSFCNKLWLLDVAAMLRQ